MFLGRKCGHVRWLHITWAWVWLAVGLVMCQALEEEGVYGGDYTVNHVAGDDMMHPSEFFKGALQRPLLQIIKPENGQVLESGEVEIGVDVSGYELPSKLHDSRVCLGVASQGRRIMESCFDQSPRMEYVVAGLQPGQSYMLRVVLFERSSALAVSVRAFRVGAVSLSSELSAGLGEGPGEVTIQTALQLGMQHHNTGQHSAAEHIYRQILEQHPNHPDALHLLGLVLYQQGNPAGAIGFLERAIHTNSTFQLFHNSLGECLRAVGRFGDAIDHFSQALALDPSFLPARFNMGLAYQQLHDWASAIQIYDEVLDYNTRHRGPPPPSEDPLLLEARTRQCDLLQAVGDFVQAQECWEAGLRQWPSHALFYNELGNVHVALDNLETAAEYYEGAMHYGLELAQLNIAIVQELEGKTHESMQRYESVLAATRAKGLPVAHIMIKRATVLPRVMPTNISELRACRSRFESKLDELLSQRSTLQDGMDNSEPTKTGFSMGTHLGYHGENNVALKTKLARVYALYCPSLLTGTFLSQDNIILQSQVAVSQGHDHQGAGPLLAPPPSTQPPSLPANASTDANATSASDNPVKRKKGKQKKGRSVKKPPVATSLSSASTGSSVAPPGLQSPFQRPLRVGFVSRFLYNHAIGMLTQGVIQHLPRPKYQVFVFMIEPPPEEDEVSRHIRRHADQVFVLPGGSLNVCAEMLRRQRLDVLVYPEVGLDPVAYFLAFSRLAPVQAVWWGHPDTTGIPSLDYFITSSVELPHAERHYSERLHRMEGLGAYFLRPTVFGDLKRQVLRERFTAELNLPPSVHLYLCPQALARFHPAFDDVLVEILAKDRLAYLLLLNGRDRQAWSKLLLSRVQSKLAQHPSSSSSPGSDHSSRVLFYSVTDEQDMLSLYVMADVVLDTFPAGGYINSLFAFAVGAPVITLPGDFLAGRLTLAMYDKMGVPREWCVASSAKHYVQLALGVAHNPTLRSRLVSRILASNYRLFEDREAIVQWDRFLTTVVQDNRHANAGEGAEAEEGLRPKAVNASEAEPALGGQNGQDSRSAWATVDSVAVV